MKSRVKITFVVPFQRFELLEQNLLDSLKEIDDEVIFIHDSIKAITDEQKKKLLPNENFKYYSGQFNSAGLARNEGIIKSTSEYIVFWDCDDFGYPKLVHQILNETKKECIAGNFTVRRMSGDGSYTFNSRKNSKSQLAVNPGLWRFIFAKKLIENIRFSNLKLGEDLLFLIDTGVLQGDIEFVSDVIYEYRISENQSTRNMEITKNLKVLIIELENRLKIQQNHNLLSFALFWRQGFSLIKRNPIEGVPFFTARVISVTKNVKFSFLGSFFLSSLIAFKWSAF